MNKQPIATDEPEVPYGLQTEAKLPRVSDDEFDAIILRAVQTYGRESQALMLFEEMAELQNAICKMNRGRASYNDVCEEIADVMIMCLQMAQFYGPGAVEDWANLKIRRLKDRLDNPQ